MPSLAALVSRIDALNRTIGRAAAWLVLAVVLLVFTSVTLRYGFNTGAIWLQEAYLWLHAAAFLLGAGYTLARDGHVRVDVLYRPASVRMKALVDLMGAVFLLLPVLLVIAWFGLPYVSQSWALAERSREAGGLPGVYLLKSLILVFCFLMMLQAIAMMGKACMALGGNERYYRPAAAP